MSQKRVATYINSVATYVYPPIATYKRRKNNENQNSNSGTVSCYVHEYAAAVGTASVVLKAQNTLITR